jgi:E3 ubiquitin-protein ligase UBR1
MGVSFWSGSCGGSVGAYLLIKKCSTLFLAAENGAFSMAPYLDEHGEHDVGMK